MPIPRPLGGLGQLSLSWAAPLLALETHRVSTLAAGQRHGFPGQSLGSFQCDSGRRHSRLHEISRWPAPVYLSWWRCAQYYSDSVTTPATAVPGKISDLGGTRRGLNDFGGTTSRAVRLASPPPTSALDPPWGSHLATSNITPAAGVFLHDFLQMATHTQYPRIKQGNCWEVLTCLQNHVLGNC